MVDKELTFLAKNEKYAFIKWQDSKGTLGRRLVYFDGSKLKYGDPAEIIPTAGGKDFKPFIDAALSEGGFNRQGYGFFFGYLAPSFDDDGIKENEVSIHYGGVDNMILKKDFYELCLLLCEAKINGLDLHEDTEVSNEDLLDYKAKLEEKIAKYSPL